MTSIPRYTSSALAQGIFYLTSHTPWQAAWVGKAAVEGLCYHSLQASHSSTPKLVKDFRATVIAHLHEIQALFNVAQVALVFFSAKELCLSWGKGSFNISPSPAHFQFSMVEGAVVLGAVGIGALSTLFLRKSPPAEVNKEVKISEEASFQQKLTQTLHIAQIVLQGAHLVWGTRRLWTLLALLSGSYSVFKNAKIQWLRFERTFSTNPQQMKGLISQVTASYQMLTLPSPTTSDEQCPICLETTTDMAFCAQHGFHKACMAEHVVTNSATLLDGSSYTRLKTEHYHNGLYTHSSYSYQVKVPRSSLPSCPLCRDYPLQNTCTVKVEDVEKGSFDARVFIEGLPSYQPLFEKVYAAYNMAQAGIALLQSSPELVPLIYKVQRFLAVTDLLGVGLTLHYLYQQLQERWKASFSKHPQKFKMAAAATAVATAALSYLATLHLNRFFKPSFSLNELFQQLPLPADALKEIDLQWATPWKHSLLQTLYLYRTITLLALSYFSPRRTPLFVSAFAQLWSLKTLSQLRFVAVQQSLQLPLEKVIASGGRLLPPLNKESLSRLQITSEFILPSFCTTEKSHLQSALQPIYDFTRRLFDQSEWKRYWLVKTKGKVKISSTLHFEVCLQNPSLPPCECGLTPQWVETSMTGVDAQYGPAQFLVNVASSTSS